MRTPSEEDFGSMPDMKMDKKAKKAGGGEWAALLPRVGGNNKEASSVKRLGQGRWPQVKRGKCSRKEYCYSAFQSHANGDFYEGQFKNGKKNGQGKMTHANGSAYEGQFKNGKKDGQGKLTIEDGLGFRVYEGKFVRGVQAFIEAKSEREGQAAKGGAPQAQRGAAAGAAGVAGAAGWARAAGAAGAAEAAAARAAGGAGAAASTAPTSSAASATASTAPTPSTSTLPPAVTSDGPFGSTPTEYPGQNCTTPVMRAAAAVVPRMVPFGMRAADGPERGQDGGPAQAAMFINYKYKRGDNLQKSTIEKEFHEKKSQKCPEMQRPPPGSCFCCFEMGHKAVDCVADKHVKSSHVYTVPQQLAHDARVVVAGESTVKAFASEVSRIEVARELGSTPAEIRAFAVDNIVQYQAFVASRAQASASDATSVEAASAGSGSALYSFVSVSGSGAEIDAMVAGADSGSAEQAQRQLKQPLAGKRKTAKVAAVQECYVDSAAGENLRPFDPDLHLELEHPVQVLSEHIVTADKSGRGLKVIQKGNFSTKCKTERGHYKDVDLPFRDVEDLGPDF